jgi:hypothetical protein
MSISPLILQKFFCLLFFSGSKEKGQFSWCKASECWYFQGKLLGCLRYWGNHLKYHIYFYLQRHSVGACAFQTEAIGHLYPAHCKNLLRHLEPGSSEKKPLSRRIKVCRVQISMLQTDKGLFHS